MALYDRILVPTDGSDEGQRAVQHAIELAVVHEATLHTVYVVNTARYAGLPMESSWEGVDELLRSDAEDAIESVRELAANAGLDVESAVIDGAPSKQIVTYAEETDCDLIVMGTHGRGGIDRLLLGSVTEKVVRSANVPVLTVRVDDNGAAAVPSATGEVQSD